MSAAVDVTRFNPLKITSVTVNWEIENIWHLSFQGTSSDAFILADNIFHLQVQRYETGIAFYLCRADGKPATMNLLFKLYMVDHIGSEKLIGEREISFQRGKEFLQSIKISELEAQKEEFIYKDKLIISCCISSSYRLNILKQQKNEDENIVYKFEKLSSDMENFFKAQTNTDALLKVENVEFPVHMAVLQARSPELASMIKNNTEAKMNLDIPDVSATVLGDVLLYVYSGKIKNLTSDRVIHVLELAKRFSLSELKDICLKFLQNNLNEDNIFEAAALSQEYNDLFLREEIEQYIMKKVPAILQSEKWIEFCKDKHKLANEILTNVFLRVQQPKDNVL